MLTCTDGRLQLWMMIFYIEMPSVTDLKVIRDNLPETLGAMSLDISLPKSRVKFIFHNGYENFDYILNPDEHDLNEE